MATIPRGDTAAAAGWLMLALAAAAAALATVWYFQLVLGYIPCKLCLQQRWPYYLGIPLLGLTLLVIAQGLAGRIVQALALAVAATFAVGVGLGVYHAGVEWGWWLGPADCGGAVSGVPADAGNLLAAMRSVRIVSCTEASWRFLGLSFAGWNVVASAAIAYGALRAVRAAHGSSSLSQ